MKSMGEMRKVNTRNSILNIVRTRKKASKFQIQKISKYSMTTILSTIDELHGSGLILPAGKGQSNGGRRPDYYAINPDGGYFIGVEFNVQVIHAVIVDFIGTPTERRRIMLEADSMTPERLMDRVLDVISGLVDLLKAKNARILGIGIGVPGQVDIESGTAVSYLRMPQWHHVPIRQMVESRFGIPTYIDTNINSIAFFFKSNNANQDCREFVLFSIRKGVRVVCFMNNQLIRGSGNSVGEIGHTPVRPGGRSCMCGRSGCLDAEATDDAIVARLQDGIRTGQYQDLFEMVGRDLTRVTISSFVESVQAGHPDTIALFEEICGYLSLNLAYVINLYNPARILIYGEITRIGQPFLDLIHQLIGQMARQSNLDRLEIDLASMQYEAGATGAAIMAMQRKYPFTPLTI
jgi:predicted NBD/HSP70 family sugar kinase